MELEKEVEGLKFRHFRETIIQNNYSKDKGITPEQFEILEELNLEKIAASVMLKLNHPFGLKNEKLLEQDMPQIKRYISCQDENLCSLSIFSPRRKRNKKQGSKEKRGLKRFSDLVNFTAPSKYYLSRDKRIEYHGSLVVKAKELEYLFLQRYNKRIASEDYFDQNRIIIGGFWMIAKSRELALSQIRGNKSYKRIMGFEKRGKSEFLNFPCSKRQSFKDISDKNNNSSSYKLKTYKKSPYRSIQPNLFQTPSKPKKLIFSSNSLKGKLLKCSDKNSQGYFQDSNSQSRKILKAPQKAKYKNSGICRLSLKFDTVSNSSQKIRDDIHQERKISSFTVDIEADMETLVSFKDYYSGKKMKFPMDRDMGMDILGFSTGKPGINFDDVEC